MLLFCERIGKARWGKIAYRKNQFLNVCKSLKGTISYIARKIKQQFPQLALLFDVGNA